MKKPNITEGEWILKTESVDDMGLHLVDSEDECAIHDSFHKANAQAISAVPEMIDALMELYRMHTMPNFTVTEQDFIDGMTKVKQALKKAGVEFGTAQES